MLDDVFFHLLGLICIVGIACCGRRIKKEAHGVQLRRLVIEILVGLIYGVAVTIFFLFINIYTDAIPASLYMHVPLSMMMYAIFMIIIIITYVTLLILNHIWKNTYFNNMIVKKSAYIAVMLIILQPIANIWLHLFCSL